ncbi:MAG: heme-binding protein [Polyangiaceae bacterium]
MTTQIDQLAAFSTPDERVARSDRMSWLGLASAYAPALGLGLGAYWALSRDARSKAILAFGSTLGFALFRWQFARFFTEKTAYEVELRSGALEIRRYAPTVRAETTVVDATWGEALDQGFKRVAGYIFGGNQQHTQIAMTAPVLANVGETERSDRTVSFIMPGNRPLQGLPVPNDTRVHLRDAPARRMGTLSFAGRYGGRLPAEKRAELLRLVHLAGYSAIGDVEFAGYDAPTTLPAFRRNEVLVELADRDSPRELQRPGLPE